MCLESKEITWLPGTGVFGEFYFLIFFPSSSYIISEAVEHIRNIWDREMKRQQGMVRSEKLSV